MKQKILIVEDNRALAMALAAKAAQLGFATELAPTLALARKALGNKGFEVVLFDLGLPDGSGMELLNEKLPHAAIITAHGELDHAIAAKKAGVNEFFVKPVDFEALEQFLRTVGPSAREEHVDREVTEGFIGEAASMRPVFQKIAQACVSPRPVLVSGSPGTGRSHVARLIYRKSENPGKLLVIDGRNMESLPDLETESSGVTLVLDHVESLAIDHQVALAKVFDQVGSGLRVIAICGSRGLLPAVKEHRFHPELYYYLQGIEVPLPALKERGEDFEAICVRFLREVSSDSPMEISTEAMRQLHKYPWPGNLRELRDVIQLSARSATNGKLSLNDLPEAMIQQESQQQTRDPLSSEIRHWVDGMLDHSDEVPEYRELLAGVESRLLADLLSRFDGKPSVMAQELKLNRSTLRKRLRELGLG